MLLPQFFLIVLGLITVKAAPSLSHISRNICSGGLCGKDSADAADRADGGRNAATAGRVRNAAPAPVVSRQPARVNQMKARPREPSAASSSASSASSRPPLPPVPPPSPVPKPLQPKLAGPEAGDVRANDRTAAAGAEPKWLRLTPEVHPPSTQPAPRTSPAEAALAALAAKAGVNRRTGGGAGKTTKRRGSGASGASRNTV